jgi:UPF0716 protein FxsA
MPLVVAIVLLPILEIALFILVGGWIGLWPTLGLVVLAVLAGAALIRATGRRNAAGLRGTMRDLRGLGSMVASDALVILAAILLIIPGFLSDMVGVLLLLPPVRAGLIAMLAARVRVAAAAAGGFGDAASRARRHPEIIDGDFHEITADDPPPRRPPSGWTRP